MDAHDKNRNWVDRLAFVALVVLLAIGLWQSYGGWLLDSAIA